VLVVVYKSTCLYKEQELVHTYIYSTGDVNLMSSTRVVKYASTGAIKYLSIESLTIKCNREVKNN
jgi:hypothetical protein